MKHAALTSTQKRKLLEEADYNTMRHESIACHNEASWCKTAFNLFFEIEKSTVARIIQARHLAHKSLGMTKNIRSRRGANPKPEAAQENERKTLSRHN